MMQKRKCVVWYLGYFALLLGFVVRDRKQMFIIIGPINNVIDGIAFRDLVYSTH